MHRWFGVHDRNGWLFVITGGVVLVAGLVLPTFTRPETRVVHERRDDGRVRDERVTNAPA